MTTQTIIKKLYAAFNERRADDVLQHMTDSVNWPKASEGGRVSGKPAIREYWTRQWSEFEPTVEPKEIIKRTPNVFTVRVHQLVKDKQDNLLFDGEVWHIYTFIDSRIDQMLIEDSSGSEQSGASAAFSH